MFWPDVVGLKQFYASPCGGYAAQLLRLALRRIWPDVAQEWLAGIGYCTPYMGNYSDQAEHAVVLMPAAQGVLHWPQNTASRTVLCDEAQLPIADGKLHRVMLVHVFEHTEQPRALLDECWRVLAPGGRLLVVVPNRRGLWVRALQGPFAYGRGFSPWQLRSLLNDQRFTPTRHDYALYLPPSQHSWLLGMARVIEGIGRQWFRGLGGVIVMEAEKQLVAPVRPRGSRIPALRLPLPVGQAVPVGRITTTGRTMEDSAQSS